jgi:hypothetical protein
MILVNSNSEDASLVKYVCERILDAKAVFILGQDGKWEFYGQIGKGETIPEHLKEPLIQNTPETPDAWWNPEQEEQIFNLWD